MRSFYRYIQSQIATQQNVSRPHANLIIEPLEERVLLTTFYVDADLGDDGNAGNRANPLATIQEALDYAAARAGRDVIKINAGEYTEDLQVNDASGSLQLRSTTGKATDVVINGAIDLTLLKQIEVRGITAARGVTATGQAKLRVRDVTVAAGSSVGLSVTDGGDVWVANSRFDGLDGVGINLETVGRVAFGNVSASQSVTGVSVDGAASFTDVRGNFSGNDIVGVDLQNIAGNVRLIRTVADGTITGDGIDMGKVGRVALRNVSASQSAVGVSVDGAASFTDVRGNFSGNDIVGVDLQNIAGNVRLIRTVADGTITGDGIDMGKVGRVALRNVSASQSAVGVSVNGAASFTDVRGNFSGNDIVGVDLQNIADNVRLIRTVADGTSAGDGIHVESARTVFVTRGNFDGNDGAGMAIEEARNVRVVRGSFSENSDHGVLLVDIKGNVQVSRVTADNNDADDDGVGDGLRAIAADNDFAINGRLTVIGSKMRDTDGIDGDAFHQQNGVFVESLSGNLVARGNDFSGNTGEGLVVLSARNVQVTDVSGNENDPGMTIVGAANVSLTGSDLSNNDDHGILLIDISGNVTITDVTANNNDANADGIGDGIRAIDGDDLDDLAIGGNVIIRGGSFSDTDGPDTGQNGRPEQQNGIYIAGVGGSVSISDLEGVSPVIEGNSGDGIFLSNVAGRVTLTNVSTSDNVGDGIELRNVGDFVATNVSSTNNDPGIVVSGAASFSDTDGNYSGNADGGILLTDIAGDVSLTRTTADDNDADDDGTGDGLNAMANLNVEAIGGDLIVSGSHFRDSDGLFGAAFHQERGVYIESIAGAVTFQDSTGVVQSVQVTGNNRDGVEIAVGGTTASFVRGTYSENDSRGIRLSRFSGAVTLTDVTVTRNDRGIEILDVASFTDTDSTFLNNGYGGIYAMNITGDVSLAGTTANDSGRPRGAIGIFLNGVGRVTTTGVTATGNNESGLEVLDAESFADTDGNYSGNDYGIFARELIGDVTLTGTTANDNRRGDGITLNDVGDVTTTNVTATGNDPGGVSVTGASSFLDTDGTYSGNADGGIMLTDINGNVTLTRTTADDNDADDDGTGDGLNAMANLNVEAIGGDLIVSGSHFRDSDGGFGAAFHQERGVFIESIAGAVTFQDSTGVVQSVEVTGNESTGFTVLTAGKIDIIGGSFSRNGFVGFNGGIRLNTVGDLTVTGVTADVNGGEGLEVVGAGNVDITGSSFSRNGDFQDGISLSTVGDVTVNGVTADDNGSNGIRIDDATSFTDTGGNFSGNFFGGISARNIIGDVSLTGTTASNNSRRGDGVDLVGVGHVTTTDVTVTNNFGGIIVRSGASFSDTDGNFSGNWNDGIRLMDIVGNVSLTRTTADDNDFENDGVGDGLYATDGGDADDVAIGGNLTVSGGSFSDTDGTGTAFHQINGISVEGIGGNASLQDSTGIVESVVASGNLRAGLQIVDAADNVEVIGGTFSNNGGDGIRLQDVVNVVLTGVTAEGNDPGVSVTGAASFSDTDGTYTGNADGGILLTDIAGDVTLTRTAADDNDADNDGVGDGFNAEDGGDADIFAIGGNLEINGGSFSAIAGTQANGIVVNFIAGTFTAQDDPAQSVLAFGNTQVGLDVFVGTSATIQGGVYSGNGNEGIVLEDITGAIDLTDVFAEDNGDANLLVLGVGNDVTITGGQFSRSVTAGGILIDNAGNVELTDVTADENQGANLDVSSFFQDLTITGGSFSRSVTGDGIRLGNGGNIELTDVTADENQRANLDVGSFVQDVTITGGSFSRSVTDAGIFLIITRSVDLLDVTADDNNLAGLFTLLADDVTITGGSFSRSVTDDGIFLGEVDNIDVRGVTADGNKRTGLDVDLADNVEVIGGTFSNNGGDGIRLQDVVNVVLTGVTAEGNDPGVSVTGAASFSDTDGTYTGNADGGILLTDIAGDVTLTRTAADDNDADNDGVGDGFNAEDGGDADIFAIGGNLEINGGSFSAIAGTQANGIVVNFIAGTFTAQDDPAQSVLAFGNTQVGLDVFVGTSATIQGGVYSGNGNEGIVLEDITGAIDLTDVFAEDNGDANLLVLGVGNDVTITGGQFSRSVTAGGILIDNAGNVELTDVTADENQGANLDVSSFFQDLTITGGSFSRSVTGDGIRLGNGGNIELTDVTADENQRANLDVGSFVQDVTITGGSFSRSVTDAGIFLIITRSVDLLDVTADDNNLAGLFTLLADDVTITGGSFSRSVTDDGIFLGEVDNIDVRGVTADGNKRTGLDVDLADNVEVIGGTFSNNGGDGIRLQDVVNVVLTGVTAEGNDPGVSVTGAASFSDTDGTYTGNADGGILLTDIAGDVTLTRTTADDNDADNDGVGDGFNAEDGGDADIFAIGGNLEINGGSFSAITGEQLYGISVVGIAGSLTLQDDVALSVTAVGNDESGLRVVDGTTATFDGGTYSSNGGEGIRLESFSDDVTLTGVIASDNVRDGFDLFDVGTLTMTDVTAGQNGADGISAFTPLENVTLTNIQANRNVGAGIRLTTAIDVTTTDVTAAENSLGLLVANAVSFSDTDGTYSGNVADGVRLFDISDHVTLTGTIANNNGADGIVMTEVGNVQLTAVTAEQNATSGLEIIDALQVDALDGSYSINGEDGFRVINALDITLDSVDARGNAGDGFKLQNVEDIDATNVTALDNASGIFVSGAVSFRDESGDYSGNANQGLRLVDVSSGAFMVDTTTEQNGDAGLLLSNVAGGSIVGAEVSSNGGAGIAIEGTTSGFLVFDNSIHDNDGLGIDLGNDGVTLNDPGDGDTGPNGLQNFPVLTVASNAAATTEISGTLNSTPNTDFVIQFYNSPVADPSGFGEGQTFLTSISVTTDASGNASFTADVGTLLALKTVVTATATRDVVGDMSTSEFSSAVLVNTPPTADAGGDYDVDEGSSVVLDGSGSNDPDQPNDTLIYEWDLDGDGVFGETGASAERGDEVGINPTFSAAGLDGPSIYEVSLRVTDDFGATDTDMADVNVLNVAPTITSLRSDATFDNKGKPDQAVNISGSYTDPGVPDTHSVVIDWGNGTRTTINEGDPEIDQVTDTFQTTHKYTTGGIFTITVTVTDDDLGADTAVTTAVVTGVRVAADGTLQIVGTNDKDKVELKQGSDGGADVINVKAKFGGSDGGTDGFQVNTADVTGILIHLCDGDDKAKIDKKIAVNAVVFAGEGKDKVKGGGGDDIIFGGVGKDDLDGGRGRDILFGEAGDDKLKGGSDGGSDGGVDAGADVLIGGHGDDDLKGGKGRDILIGGQGADKLAGGSDGGTDGKGDDILIAGFTSYDNNILTLSQLRDDWTTDESYETRVDNITSGAGPNLVVNVSVFDDGDKDELKGGKGRDLFFAAPDDKVKDKKDDETLFEL